MLRLRGEHRLFGICGKPAHRQDLLGRRESQHELVGAEVDRSHRGQRLGCRRRGDAEQRAGERKTRSKRARQRRQTRPLRATPPTIARPAPTPAVPVGAVLARAPRRRPIVSELSPRRTSAPRAFPARGRTTSAAGLLAHGSGGCDAPSRESRLSGLSTRSLAVHSCGNSRSLTLRSLLAPRGHRLRVTLGRRRRFASRPPGAHARRGCATMRALSSASLRGESP